MHNLSWMKRGNTKKNDILPLIYLKKKFRRFVRDDDSKAITR